MSQDLDGFNDDLDIPDMDDELGEMGVDYKDLRRTLQQTDTSVTRLFQHKPTGNEVVLKTYFAEGDTPALAKAEVKTLSVFEGNPHIVQMTAAWEAGGFTHLAFDNYPDGLDTLLADNKSGLGVDKSRAIGAQLLKALSVMHEKKVVHLGLCPSSVRSDPVTANIRLTSFKHAVRHGVIMKGRVRTEPQLMKYMAPEVLAGDNASTAADIWSFGCVLGEILTGHPTMRGMTAGDVVLFACKDVGAPPQRILSAIQTNLMKSIATTATMPIDIREGALYKRLVVNDCDAEMLEVVTRCLNMDPKKRPTAEELLAAPPFSDAPNAIAGIGLSTCALGAGLRMLAAANKRESMHVREAGAEPAAPALQMAGLAPAPAPPTQRVLAQRAPSMAPAQPAAQPAGGGSTIASLMNTQNMLMRQQHGGSNGNGNSGAAPAARSLAAGRQLLRKQSVREMVESAAAAAAAPSGPVSPGALRSPRGDAEAAPPKATRTKSTSVAFSMGDLMRAASVKMREHGDVSGAADGGAAKPSLSRAGSTAVEIEANGRLAKFLQAGFEKGASKAAQ